MAGPSRALNRSTFSSGVAEIQGLYGAYSFPEKLLQKIWLRGDFDRTRMVTTDGRRVRVRHPGKWNLLGGPDFRGARLAIGDAPEVTGDVELHLHGEGWEEHRHAQDRAYDGVLLHVVLFPPDPGHVTRDRQGHPLPVVALLPLLHHDLEQFAAEEATETLANRPLSRIHEELAPLPVEELRALLRRHAEKRWAEKCRFAGVRVARLGWTEACHHTALEILGYRFNRAPMLRLAAAFPFASWSHGRVDPVAAWTSEIGHWSLQGVRPANRPRIRLQQYAHGCRHRPDWPERLAAMGATLPALDPAALTRAIRRGEGFVRLRSELAEAVSGGAVAGPRCDNLICDGFLPLLASGQSPSPLFGLWSHWYPGDIPPVVIRALQSLGATDAVRPVSQGLVQGILGWMLAHEPAPS